MQIPLQVTFEGCNPSEAVRAAIEREVERLEKHNRHIIGCHVAVIAPSHKHRHGTGFQVHISLTIPPHENPIVNHAPSNDNRYEAKHHAVKKAVRSASGQIDAPLATKLDHLTTIPKNRTGRPGRGKKKKAQKGGDPSAA